MAELRFAVCSSHCSSNDGAEAVHDTAYDAKSVTTNMSVKLCYDRGCECDAPKRSRLGLRKRGRFAAALGVSYMKSKEDFRPVPYCSFLGRLWSLSEVSSLALSKTKHRANPK